MYRLERFLSHPIHYYVPLVPRLGVTYTLTPYDKKIIENQSESTNAKQLIAHQGKEIIPLEHYNHFIYGSVIRTVINISFCSLIGYDIVPVLLPTALCFFLNEPRYNYIQVDILRRDLKSSMN